MVGVDDPCACAFISIASILPQKLKLALEELEDENDELHENLERSKKLVATLKEKLRETLEDKADMQEELDSMQQTVEDLKDVSFDILTDMRRIEYFVSISIL
tara:strand:+ start:2142 stop:2450 length:309 start_codon:yes stop_codon:yes gene_type:complete